MVDIYRRREIDDIYSDAIKDIANRQGVMFISTHGNFFISSAFLNTMVQGHPTNQTYTGMATAFDELFSENYLQYHTYLFKQYNGYVH